MIVLQSYSIGSLKYFTRQKRKWGSGTLITFVIQKNLGKGLYTTSLNEEHCLSKQIDQVDLPGIASSGILHVQESGYKSEEEPMSIKLCVKTKDSIFSYQSSSQIPQQHTSKQQSYGSTSIASN